MGTDREGFLVKIDEIVLNNLENFFISVWEDAITLYLG